MRDAVLGRSARLGPAARMLLDAIAVAGRQTELWLLDALASDYAEHLEECVGSGIVVTRTNAVAFSHELARLAVEESIPLQRRLALHRAALAALQSPPEGAQELARLAHHAQAAGDPESLVKFAPLAGAHASRLGAHREAAVHYGEALRFPELVPLDSRAALFAGRAMELFLTVQLEEAADALEQALRCYEELGIRSAKGAALSFLAQLRWQVGSLPEGLATASNALEELDGVPGSELVGAYAMMAALQLAAEDLASAMTWAKRAENLAGQLDRLPSRILALQMVGWVEFLAGTPGGVEKLASTLELGLEAGLEDVVAVTYVILVRTAGRLRQWRTAGRYLRAGLEYCSTRDIDIWRYYLLGWEAKTLLAHGQWTEAAQTALICLEKECPFARIHALVALGLVRARRGDPDAWGPLDEALTHAEPRQELHWIGPVAVARAEAAWLEGRRDAVGPALEPALGFPMRRGDPYAVAIAYWARRAELEVEIPADVDDPYALEVAGDWAAASERWTAIGCPYEAALALSEAEDHATLQRALAELQALGARPAAAIVARRLRERGARSLRRGQRAATRANPANLTPREVEVLALVALGLHNSEIAGRLFLAEKTVGHHVSAILRKLGVSNRVQAVTEARRLGIADEVR